MGWQVTATDLSEDNLNVARERAKKGGVDIILADRDLTHLGYTETFDCVVSCTALYDVPEESDIRSAIVGMFAALKPGGRCYLRLRDNDHLVAEKPRHKFHGEVETAHGWAICIEDWDFDSPHTVIHIYTILTEDTRHSDCRRWPTETLDCRIRLLRKAELERYLTDAGFTSIEFLPHPNPWAPYEVIATR